MKYQPCKLWEAAKALYCDGSRVQESFDHFTWRYHLPDDAWCANARYRIVLPDSPAIAHEHKCSDCGAPLYTDRAVILCDKCVAMKNEPDQWVDNQPKITVARTPKMPDAAVWWIRRSGYLDTLVTFIGDDCFGSDLTRRHLPDMEHEKILWSPDRKRWFNFYGEEVK